MRVDINDFHQEKECAYKGERYFVRDNGAVLRCPREGKHPRPTDNKWTFGKQNEKTGYMEIATERVHRIVAVAFLGEPPNKEYVVDHIDTNRCNNRPENLQWLTRLENALKNPITARKIEIICGSIEAFLADPSILRENSSDPNFKWMRRATPQEAKICLQNMQNWAKSKRKLLGGTLGEWIYKPRIISKPLVETSLELTSDFPYYPQEENTDPIAPELPILVMAKTQGAAQKDWSIPSEFPCCPQETDTGHVVSYAERLKEGVTLARNDVYESIVLQSSLSNDNQTIYVMTESKDKDAIKPWALAKITYENGLYIHTNLGSFFSKDGAEKQFTLAQGLEWTGGDSIDDYC
jgi:hypothetical protein